MISFDKFKQKFDELTKDKMSSEEFLKLQDDDYKDVEEYTFGDQNSGVRVAQILNEFRSNRYRKKSMKFLNFSNKGYQSIEKIKDPKVRKYLVNIFHPDRKRILHTTNLPPVLRNHMYAYITGKYRNILSDE